MSIYKTLLDILLSVEVNMMRVRLTLSQGKLKNLFDRIDIITQDSYLTISDVNYFLLS